VPEGDTIYRAAAALRTALVGKTLTKFEAARLVGPVPKAGAAIESVDSHGKHLEIIFDDGIVLHTHMRMTGSWHLYHPGQKWRKRRHQARVIIETDEWIAVAFNAPIVETYRHFDQTRHPRAGRLGPDLCRADADVHECAARLFHYDRPEVTVAEALLDQRVMNGVGNVFRCEVLWSCGVHPWAPVSSIPQSTCLDLVLTAAGLLRANLGSSVRVTAPDVPGGLAVYGRNGQKCSRCGDVIRLTKMGEMNRLLYWCPGCQVAFEPYPERDDSDSIARATDPHPAGSQFVSDILRHRPAS
jgi:endonuclease-8